MYVLANWNKLYLSREYQLDTLLPDIPSKTLEWKKKIKSKLKNIVSLSSPHATIKTFTVSFEKELKILYKKDVGLIELMPFFHSGIEILLLLLTEYKKEVPEFYNLIQPGDKDKQQVEFLISLINSADQ